MLETQRTAEAAAGAVSSAILEAVASLLDGPGVCRVPLSMKAQHSLHDITTVCACDCTTGHSIFNGKMSIEAARRTPAGVEEPDRPVIAVHGIEAVSLESARRDLVSELVRAERCWRFQAQRKFLRLAISEARAMPLIWVSRLGNGVWQSEVAKSIGVRAATLADMVTQLETAKLLERREDPSDQRAKALWLTDEGAAVAAKLEDLLSELHEDVLSDFDASELAIATKVLRRISMRQAKPNRFRIR